MKPLLILSLLISMLIIPQCIYANTCPPKGTYIFFANGMNNKIYEAEASLTWLKEEILSEKSTSSLKNEPLTFELSYNDNEVFWAQLLEVFRQKFTGSWSYFFQWMVNLVTPPGWFQDKVLEISVSANKINYLVDQDLQEFVKRYREIVDKGYKVLVVSHSQGNFYANSAYEYMNETNHPNRTNSFGIVGIGTPASEVAGNGNYTTLKEDLVMRGVRLFFPPPLTLLAKTENNYLFFPLLEDWKGHSLTGAYLNGDESQPEIMTNIYEAIAKLEYPPSNINTGEFLVNTYTQRGQNNPDITSLADGGFVVVWHRYMSRNNYDIYGQRYNANGIEVGDEFQVNEYRRERQWYPTVGSLKDGGFVVTWSSNLQDGSQNGVYSQRYDVNSTKVGGEFQVNTYTLGSQRNFTTTSLGDGGFVITWTSYQDGSKNGVYGQRYDADGVKAGGEFQINSYTDGGQEWPSVASLENGGFVVVWSSYMQNGDDWYDVYGQRYDVNGVKAGDEFQINSYTNGGQEWPSVASLEGGGFVVTWGYLTWHPYEFPRVVGRGVHGQRYDVNSTKVGGEFQVTNHLQSERHQPNLFNGFWNTVAPLAGGGFVVVWQSDGGDGNTYGIYGQQYEASGAKAGGEFLINSFATDSMFYPVVTTFGYGGFVVAWQSDGDIHAKIFGCN